MLKKGMDVELISDITELPIEEVITLKQGQLNGNR